MADQASRFGQPEKICDIVLKGGITSGVVYPLALVSLAEKYRFSNIGGTSAGAIAAVAAAAAEYGRHTEDAGFDRLEKIPDEVGSSLLSMFQPTPALKPLFDIFVAALKAKTKTGRIIAITAAAVGGYWLSALLGLLPGLVVALIALAIGGGAGFVAFGLLLALIGLVAGVIWRLVKAANADLVGSDFGLCPGIRQPDFSKEGFTDWLARLIDEAAGNKTGRPLTFGDLAAPPNGRPPIQLAMMISLDDYDEKRNRDDVWLPSSSGSGSQLPVQPFDGLGGFLMRLLMSAKDWQDNLQSTLPGYRERIAHVVLKPEQGGLNLAMDEATIRKLVNYGEQAGETLRDEFDLDGHRWRRFLVAMARMEETLDEVAKAYEGVPGGPEAFGDFLKRYSGETVSYRQDATRLAEMLKRGAELAASGAGWRAKPTIREGNIPKPATNLRITPKP